MPDDISGTIAATAGVVGSKQAPTPTQSYNFSVDSFDVLVPRSGSVGGLEKGDDSDYVGFAIQVNNNPTQKLTKFIGNNCHSGVFTVGLAFDNVSLADTDAVALIITVVNSSAGETATTQYLDLALTKLGSAAGGALVKYLENQLLTQSVKDEISAAIGGTIGTIAVPLIGSALGALGGFLIGEALGLLFPDCDGPVAAMMLVYSGAELKALTASGQPVVTTTDNPGITSPDGCGGNSDYTVTYSVQTTPPPVPTVTVPNIKGMTLADGLRALGAVGLIGIERLVPSDLDPPSIIIGQTPSAGSLVSENSEVQFDVPELPKGTHLD
jgi:hypothetical protein